MPDTLKPCDPRSWPAPPYALSSPHSFMMHVSMMRLSMMHVFMMYISLMHVSPMHISIMGTQQQQHQQDKLIVLKFWQIPCLILQFNFLSFNPAANFSNIVKTKNIPRFLLVVKCSFFVSHKVYHDAKRLNWTRMPSVHNRQQLLYPDEIHGISYCSNKIAGPWKLWGLWILQLECRIAHRLIFIKSGQLTLLSCGIGYWVL